MKRIVGFGAVTQKGSWPIQEDAFWVDPIQGIFVLADGFGGISAGDVAAATAVATVGEFLASPERLNFQHNSEHPFYSSEESQVAEAFRLAAQAIAKQNESKAADVRGGATLILAVFHSSGRAIIGNLGNTGAVILRSGKTVSILPSQSFAAHQGDVVGRAHPSFGIDFPLQFLGLFPKVEPDIRTFHFQAGDHLLLFTEGLLEGRGEVLSQAAVLVAGEKDMSPAGEGSLRLEELAKEIMELAGPSDRPSNRNRSLILVESRPN